MRESDRDNELHWGSLHACVEISQWHPLGQLIYANKMEKKSIDNKK
jgi:hypothetical protein